MAANSDSKETTSRPLVNKEIQKEEDSPSQYLATKSFSEEDKTSRLNKRLRLHSPARLTQADFKIGHINPVSYRADDIASVVVEHINLKTPY
jgi:hypothetical protein